MIVAVASGKGGTGKTTVATSLALALNDRPIKIADCDVEAPNAHIFLKPRIEKIEKVYTPVPVVDESACSHCGKCAQICQFNALAVLQKQVMVFQNLCHGCGACLLACPESAITEGRREVGVLESGECSSMAFIHGKLNIGEAMAPPVIRAVKGYLNQDEDTIVDVPISCCLSRSRLHSD